MADKKISEFESFPGKQDSKTHYVVSSGDSGGSDTTNYKVSFTDLVSGISGELSDSLGGGGGGEGTPGPGGSFNFGPTNPSNNSDVINFNQGETVRMYIDENGGVNVSEKLVVANGKETVLGGVTTIKDTLTVVDGKETILGGNTTVKKTLTVADGEQTILGGPVTVKGSTTHEGGLFTTSDTTTTLFKGPNTFGDSTSDITNFLGTTNITGPLNLKDPAFSVLTSDPDPSTGKLYRKGDDLYFDGKKLLTDGTGGGSGKWSDGTSAGQIHYSGGNVGIGTTSPESELHVHGDITLTGLTSGNQGTRVKILHTTGTSANGEESKNDGGFVFQSNDNGTLINGLSIDHAGKVGIGTTSPDSKLHINSTTDTTLPGLGSSGGSFVDTTAGNRGLVAGNLLGGNYYMQVQRVDGTNTAYNLLLQANGGNVGIGTTNPTAKLEVKGGESFRVIGTDNTTKLRVYSDNHGAVLGLGDPAGDDDLIRLDARSQSPNTSWFNSGDLGIGIKIPDSLLHVNKPGNEVVPLLTLSNYDNTNGSTSHGSALDFGLARDTGSQKSNAGRIYVGKTEVWESDDATLNSFMSFSVLTGMVSSEKMRITSEGVGINGKIGINLATPTYHIDAKPINQSDQFVARFTTEHNNDIMHSSLIFSKTKQDGTATESGSLMGSLMWQGKDTDNTVRSCGMIKVVQRGAANASGRIADMYFHTADGNLYDNNESISNDTKHEKLRLKGGGGVILARLDSAPSDPDAGEMYFNTTNNTFYGYNGTSWKALHS